MVPIIIRDEHDLFYKFIKMKPPIFHGTDFENVYEFIIDFHERLNNIRVT